MAKWSSLDFKSIFLAYDTFTLALLERKKYIKFMSSDIAFATAVMREVRYLWQVRWNYFYLNGP